MHRSSALGLLIAVTLAPSLAWAEGVLRRTVGPGGGLDAFEVVFDAKKATISTRRCASAECADGKPPKEIPIPIPARRIHAGASTVDILPMGGGRQVARVRVVDAERNDIAFEALFSGMREEPLFAAMTGPLEGDDGVPQSMVLVQDRDATSKTITVVDYREGTRICGQPFTPQRARRVDPSSMQLREGTMDHLEKKVRDAAPRLVARVRSENAVPLAQSMLVASGGSAPSWPVLTDGRADASWPASKAGSGHGEYALLRAPAELPIHAVVITMAAPKQKADKTSSRSFFLATDNALVHVSVPEDAAVNSVRSYEIVWPAPVRTTCLAVVLDEDRLRPPASDVAITEIVGLTKFDIEGAKLEDVAKALASPRAEEAAALLRRAGPHGVTAVVREYPMLDSRGRALAIDVVSSVGTCDGASGTLLTQALADKEREVRMRAQGRIQRCGKSAANSLAEAVRADDEARRVAAAPLLVSVAPRSALVALSEQLGKGSPETRRAIRASFSRAAPNSSRDKLLGLLTDRNMTPVVRLELLRALGPAVSDVRRESNAVVAELLRESTDMPTRYLLAEPLAQLARTEGATEEEFARLRAIVLRDPDPPVRARALELSAGIAALLPTFSMAALDPDPRVREAALHAIGRTSGVSDGGPAIRAIKDDDWTFVRVAAASALGGVKPDTASTKALAAALADSSPKVRLAALAALGKQKNLAAAESVRARLDDAREDLDVRALAARTLGDMCVQESVDRLTKLAMLARTPADAADVAIGMAAIEALGALHPVNLEARLAPLRAKEIRSPIRRAADRALSEPGNCR